MSNSPKTVRSNAKPAAGKAKSKPPTSKLDQIVAALRSRKGATVAHLAALTGWQPHSVRGAMAGTLKKKRGLKIVSEKTGPERIYRLAGPR